ncbi:PmoA family protein [Actinoplanes sp. NPDC051494]|uniref:PmoA family protein n=1 Tax=Actinoplanes sp. NPDC051494 TaxID=3363907 RepID=UPI00378A615A
MSTELSVGGTPVATIVADPQLDIRLGPRPYLHPVRTLGGTVVTDALCEDHPWHMGVSVAMQDVDGVNFWGGRTYVRDQGYTWLDDHGRITPGGEWQDQTGRALLSEKRQVTAAATQDGWELTYEYALTAPATRDVTLGSPATNGRPGGAGYGGFFWRGAPVPGAEVVAWTASADGEAAVNGSAEPWVAVRAGNAYTLVFRGLRDDDRWFVRTGDYVGVCAALAFERPLTIRAGTTLSREIRVSVTDGAAGPPRPLRLRRATPPSGPLPAAPR